MLKPDYSNCIIKIIMDIRKDISSSRKKKIVFILIDAFGYKIMKRLSKTEPGIRKVLKRFDEERISSVFPTSTCPAICSIKSGQCPQEHGLYDWVIYSKEANMRFLPLLMAPVDEKDNKRFEKFGKKQLVKHKNLLKILEKENIEVHELYPKKISISTFTEFFKSRNVHSYNGFYDVFVKLRKIVKSADKGSFFYVYIPDFDSQAHETGPYSEEAVAVIKMALRQLEKDFLNRTKDAEVLISADHGSMTVRKNYRLLDKKWFRKMITPCFRKYKGKSVLPTGGPRDLFLHIKEEKIGYVQGVLQKKLKNIADVVLVKDIIEKGYFGNKRPSRKFLETIGNVLVLPKKDVIIEFEKRPVPYKGMHGGLSEDELYVPLLRLKK